MEAETDDEPWDDGSTIYHANIVMLPKSGQLPPAKPPTRPQLQVVPPANVSAPKSALEIPSPFTGEASDIDSQTIKKYASSLYDQAPPVRPEPNKFFDPVPPARLSTTYTGVPNAFFDPVPPAKLAPNYNPQNYQPPAAQANPVDDSDDDTVAFRPLSHPEIPASKPSGVSNNTLLYLFIGLLVLFAILMILFFVTR